MMHIIKSKLPHLYLNIFKEVDDEFLEEDDYVDEEYGMYRESSSTPVLDTEEYRQRYKQYADGPDTGDYEQYPSGKY